MKKYSNGCVRGFALLASFVIYLCARQMTGQTVRHAEAHRPALGPSVTEDQLFDANRQTPTALLRQLYEDHKVLVLSHSSHGDDGQYRVLNALLREIGQDPRLTRIILERASEDAPLLEQYSVANVSEPDLWQAAVRQLGSASRAKIDLCLDGEFASTWAKFLPSIRAINATRPTGHKLLVTSVDGIDLTNSPASDRHVHSPGREIATRDNFARSIWPRLATTDSEKIIVLYHSGHVLRTVTTPPDTSPWMNWLSLFLRQHPEAASHIAIALIDQPEGVTKFTRRQIARFPTQPFAVRLSALRDVLPERGKDNVFVAGFFLGPYQESAATLPQMADAVVRIPQQAPFGAPDTYMPSCK
jgi:hypothetical protein